MRTAADIFGIRTAIGQVASELAGMIREVPDGTRKLRRSNWTVGETAAHLAIAQKGLADIATEAVPNPFRRGAIDEFAPINESYLASFPERDTARLADLLLSRTAEFLARVGELPEHERVPAPFGEVEVGVLYAYDLAHLMMHGHPLARFLGHPTPVNRERALLVLPFLQMVPAKVFDQDAGRNLSACLEVRFRRGPRFWVVFERGVCRVEALPCRRVDCTVLADPAAFFLVATGAESQWGPIVSGKMIAWGPRPWIALKLKTLLPNP